MMSRKIKKKLTQSFNIAFRYFDVVLALNNSKIGYYDDQIYLIDLEIKDTTYVAMLISNIDMCITIDRDVR